MFYIVSFSIGAVLMVTCRIRTELVFLIVVVTGLTKVDCFLLD